MKYVIDEYFLPNFRADRYQIGILTGVEETIREIAGVYPGQYENGTLARGFSTIGRCWRSRRWGRSGFSGDGSGTARATARPAARR